MKNYFFLANSAISDEMPPYAEFHQGLHYCFPVLEGLMNDLMHMDRDKARLKPVSSATETN